MLDSKDTLALAVKLHQGRGIAETSVGDEGRELPHHSHRHS